MEQFGAVTGFRLSLKATDLDSLRYARRRWRATISAMFLL